MEATSNVDLEIDALVQNTVLELDATVISICHRLQHVARYDRVIVMGDGEVLEDGIPAELLNNKDSHLAAFYSEAGLA